MTELVMCRRGPER